MDSAGLNVIVNSRVAPGANSITRDGCGVEKVRVNGDVNFTFNSLLQVEKINDLYYINQSWDE